MFLVSCEWGPVAEKTCDDERADYFADEANSCYTAGNAKNSHWL